MYIRARKRHIALRRTLATIEMKKILISIFLLIFCSGHSQSKLTIDGFVTAAQKALYFQNPLVEDLNNYCVDSVYLNSQKIQLNFHLAAFMIELERFGLRIGDSVNIVVYHKSGCKPKLLTNNHLPRYFPFVSVEIKIDGDYSIQMKKEDFQYIQPQIYIWNKWLNLDSIVSNQLDSFSRMEGKFWLPFGKHNARIAAYNQQGYAAYSKEFIVEGSSKPNSYELVHQSKKIRFIRSSHYEIYNTYGVRLLKGYDSHIDVKGLNKGVYYLNYELENFKIEIE